MIMGYRSRGDRTMKGYEMTESKARFSVENPSPASVSLANFINELPEFVESGEEMLTDGQVEAVRRFFSAWQQSPARETERAAEKLAAKAARDAAEGEALIASEEKLREKLAKIELAKAERAAS
jgi:acyl-CoA reductase-like NAD-dependent aldehyde dehydrogenase